MVSEAAMNVLVTDGENRSALAVTRSLGRKGCRVVVTGTKLRNLSSCSRFCSKGFAVPDPLRDGAAYLKAMGEIVRREGIHIIFPMTEQSICLLNRYRDTMPEDSILACPVEEKMRAISDKSNLFRMAEMMDVPIPGTVHVSGPDDLPSRIDRIDRYPVVIKPARSRILQGDGFISGEVLYASSRRELEHLYSVRPSLRFPSMIQEKIVGPGTGLFTLYNNNRHLALFSHRRLREKPPSGGVSVVSESVPLDEEMVEASGRLLSSVGWTGVAMVEFKRDRRDGIAKLMEINGRFWGSLQLAIACGVDFPGLLFDFLRGEPLPPLMGGYRLGHKLKWFFGTLDHLVIRLKNRDEELNLPPGYPSRLRSIADFLKIEEDNTSFDVYEEGDSGPFLFEAKSYLRHAVGLRG